MLEAVHRVGRQPTAVDQAGVGQARQRVVQFDRVQRQHGRQRGVGKLAPDRRTRLRHLLDHRQAVQPRQQRIVQSTRHRHRAHRAGEHETLGLLAHQARLQHRLGQFLHVERDAVALDQDVLQDLGGQGLAARVLRHDAGAVVALERAQLHRQRVRQLGPGRLEFGPGGGQHHDTRGHDALGQPLQQAQRGGVGPVQVLEQDQQRALARQRDEDRQQRAQGQFALAFRAVAAGRVAARRGHRQQRGEIRHRRGQFVGRQPGHQQPRQLVQALIGGVVFGKAGAMADLADHRVQRGILELLGTEVAQQQERLCASGLAHGLGQAGFAQPGVAAQRDHAPLAGTGQPPAIHQCGKLDLAADHGGQGQLAAVTQRSRFIGAFAAHAPDRYRLGKTLEHLRPQVLAVEAAAEQPVRAGGDDHLAGQRQRLQPCGQVGRAADHGFLARRALADDVTDHHGAGGDAHAHAQPHAAGQGLQRRHFGGQFEAGPHGAPGVVLVRPRVAEQGEDAVAHVAVHEALMACDDAAGAVLEGAQHGAQFLGVERIRQARRVGEVAEHDRDLAPLGLGLVRRGGGCRLRAGRVPHQHHAVLVARHALAQNQFLLQVLQALFVEPELAPERGVGDAVPAAEQVDRGIQELFEGHAQAETGVRRHGSALVLSAGRVRLPRQRAASRVLWPPAARPTVRQPGSTSSSG